MSSLGDKLTLPMVYVPFRLVRTLSRILTGLSIVLIFEGVPFDIDEMKLGGWTWTSCVFAMQPVYVQGLHILRQPSDALAVTCDSPVSVMPVHDISTWILTCASTTHLAS